MNGLKPGKVLEMIISVMNAKSLELKVPPAVVSVLFAVIMWVISLFSPDIVVQPIVLTILLFIMILIGLIFAVTGVLSFYKSQTTVNPITPEAASSLVTVGIYCVSRNPMYIGFLCFLFAWAIYLSNLFSLAVAFGFILYMNLFQIIPEERILEEVFGEDYRCYKKTVRRWI